jgi:hypothetical protein
LVKLWGIGATASIAVTVLLSSCGILDPDLDTVGTVELREIEGGCWVIETSDRVLQPTNLPQEFKVDGLRVRFEADFQRDLEGWCPGEFIELKMIERA